MELIEKVKEIFNSLVEPDNEKKMQQWTDAGLNFLFVEVPKGAISLAKNLTYIYTVPHDYLTMAMSGKRCKADYRSGDLCCIGSRNLIHKELYCPFIDHRKIRKREGRNYSYAVCNKDQKKT